MKRNAIIFDLDRTLVDISDIEHLLEGAAGEDDYHEFHQASRDVPAVPWVRALVGYTRYQGIGAIAVTARNEQHRAVTSEWFALNGITMDATYMRPADDARDDHDMKRDLLHEIRQSWNPLYAFDDRDDVLRMWRSEGIEGTLVAPNGIETPRDLQKHMALIDAIAHQQRQENNNRLAIR